MKQPTARRPSQQRRTPYNAGGESDALTRALACDLAQEAIDYLDDPEDPQSVADPLWAAGMAVEVHYDAGWIDFCGDVDRASFTLLVARVIRALTD
jgi:hypothetical protein